ncbi:hypothetical protein RJT34_18531 [Clitoria ternatea]|uniref:Cyclotide n=1 Tax=Clitoria ternatea TaxID=43366 RepID=A0AAN9JAZ4_CLITE
MGNTGLLVLGTLSFSLVSTRPLTHQLPFSLSFHSPPSRIISPSISFRLKNYYITIVKKFHYFVSLLPIRKSLHASSDLNKPFSHSRSRETDPRHRNLGIEFHIPVEPKLEP